MKKKRGRPVLPPGEGKRYPLNMRTTKDVRDRLEAAAAASGRSLAQEVEYRLEKSFWQDSHALNKQLIETINRLDTISWSIHGPGATQIVLIGSTGDVRKLLAYMEKKVLED